MHDFRKAWRPGTRLFGEDAWLKVFYSALYLQILMLQLFPPISHLIWWAGLPFIFLSLPPPFSIMANCVKLLATARKSFRGLRKLSRRSTMTRPWEECGYKCLPKGEEEETVAAAADQRNLNAKASIADIAAELKNDWPESVKKLTQAHDVSARMVQAILMRICSSQRSWPGGWPNSFPWRWRRSDLGRERRPKWWRPRFFDSLRQCSHCLWAGEGRRANWLASFLLRRPLRRAGMGVPEIARRWTSPRCSGSNKSAAWSAWTLPASILRKAKNTKWPNYNCLFLLRFSSTLLYY